MQKETNQAEKDAAKRDCEKGGNGNYKAGKCKCKKGYTLSGTYCIQTSVKEKTDVEFQEDLNKQKQSIGAKLEQNRQTKLNTTLEESNKQVQDKFAAERQKSLERMEDRSGQTLKNNRPTATLSTTSPGDGMPLNKNKVLTNTTTEN